MIYCVSFKNKKDRSTKIRQLPPTVGKGLCQYDALLLIALFFMCRSNKNVVHRTIYRSRIKIKSINHDKTDASQIDQTNKLVPKDEAVTYWKR